MRRHTPEVRTIIEELVDLELLTVRFVAFNWRGGKRAECSTATIDDRPLAHHAVVLTDACVSVDCAIAPAPRDHKPGDQKEWQCPSQHREQRGQYG